MPKEAVAHESDQNTQISQYFEESRGIIAGLFVLMLAEIWLLAKELGMRI